MNCEPCYTVIHAIVQMTMIYGNCCTGIHSNRMKQDEYFMCHPSQSTKPYLYCDSFWYYSPYLHRQLPL